MAEIIQSQFARFSLFLGAVLASCAVIELGWVARRWWVILALCILAFDVLSLGRTYVRRFDGVYSDLRETRELLKRRFSSIKEQPFRVGSSPTVYGPNIDMYYGLQTPVGAGPLILKRCYRFWDASMNPPGPMRWQSLWYEEMNCLEQMDLMNVHYEIDHQSRKIIRLDDVLPRAYLVHRWKVLSGKDLLTEVLDEAFDPLQRVYLESEPSWEEQRFQNIEVGGHGESHIQEYRPDYVRIRVKTDRRAVLVLHDAFDPGWRCIVDGIETTPVRANYLFRAVPLTAGDHTVEWMYDPWTVRVGAIISIGTLILVFIAVLVAVRRKVSE